MNWKRAFEDAEATEAEGAKSFEGFFKKSRIEGIVSKLEDKNISSINDSTTRSEFRPTFTKAVEKEDVERGGFCQPSGLAAFVKFQNKKGNKDVQKNNQTVNGTIVENIVHQDESAKNEVLNPGLINDVDNPDENEGKENGMARQICRAWLKNTYLQLGQPCKNPNCERRHLIESKSVGSLYKDYSFKGLTTAQRNSIINQVQSAAATVVHPTEEFLSIVATESSETSCKPAETGSDIKIDSIDSTVINHESSDVLSDDKASKCQLDSISNTPILNDPNTDASIQDIELTGSRTKEILHNEKVSLDPNNEIISHSDNYIEMESHAKSESHIVTESCDIIIEENICDDTLISLGDKSSKKKKRAKKNDNKIDGNIKVTEPCAAIIEKNIDDVKLSSVGSKSSNKKKVAKKNDDQDDGNIKSNLHGDMIMINEIPLVITELSTSIIKKIRPDIVNVSQGNSKNMLCHEKKINLSNEITDNNIPLNSVDHHGTMNEAFIAQKNKLNDLLKKPRSSWTPTHQNYKY